jgi:hypothetical protein
VSRDEMLFREGDLDATLRAHAATLAEKVDAIPRDQFMNAPADEAAEHIAAKLAVEALVLHEGQALRESRETKIDIGGRRDRYGGSDSVAVPALEIVVSIPYTGDTSLWKLRSNPRQSVYPYGEIIENRYATGGTLIIRIQQPVQAAIEQFKAYLEDNLSRIRFFLGAQAKQIEQFNSGLLSQALQAVQARRQRIEKLEGVESLLGIPLKCREGVPELSPVRMERKLVRPLPPPPSSGFVPEFGIIESDYEHILSVIRQEGRTFEATPATYAVHGEEHLRNIMLAHLNGHYRGDATGETFRLSGKTDIRIEADNRAAFVAECKIWSGPRDLTDAVKQLLGYLTWRDCKVAIILFNKDVAGFSGILESIPTVFEQLPQYRKTLKAGNDGEWEFRMTSLEDEGRLVRVHVFAFNLYQG